MAGNEDAREYLAEERLGRQARLGRDQRIDAGVPRHVHIATDTLGAQVRSGPFARGEQQVGPRVYSGAIFLLGPRQARIMCP